MKIKRYLVREMQEAIRLIKEDLGSDAVIVSSYKVPARGLIGLFSPRLLEITAVLDDKPEIQLNVGCPPAQMAVAASAESAGEIIFGGDTGEVHPAGRLIEPDIDREPDAAAKKDAGWKYFDPLSRELKKSLTTKKFSGWPIIEEINGSEEEKGRLFEKMLNRQLEAGLNEGPGAAWRRMLLDMDIGADIVERLIPTECAGKDQPDGQHIYFSLLKQVVNLLEPAYQAANSPRILTFMGPPGGGKTTSLAKLATRFKIFNNKKIALVGISKYRIGGFDQLQSYGNFLDVPVNVAMTPVELAKILENHDDKDYILIDTDGRSAWDTGQVLELKSFLNVSSEPQGNFLVLSATSKNNDLIKTAEEFRRVGFSKFIFTRVDETETHGSILNLALKTGVPVAYLANGQNIPDDITEANPNIIAKLLFREVDPGEIMASWERSRLSP